MVLFITMNFGQYGYDRKSAIKGLLKKLGDIEKMLEHFELYFDVDRSQDGRDDDGTTMKKLV